MKPAAAILLLLFLLTCNSLTRDIVVSNNGENRSIKESIAASVDGDRVIVKSGYYAEGSIIIDRSIQLIGEDYPVLDGKNACEIITVRSNNITVKGFTVQNSGVSNLIDYAGIRVEDSKDCVIDNNRLINNFFSIYLANSTYCRVSGNFIKSNAVSESSSGNGIHLWKCNNITIEGNNISNQRDGIYFEFVTDSRIANNMSVNNLRYGLHFMFSNGDSYEYNVFSNNGAGVAVMYTKNVRMIGNRFENNWGPNSYGLLLKEIDNAYIYKNTFFKNTTGIYMESGTNLDMLSNNFNENGWAMKILGNCVNDTVQHNNFTLNTFDVATNTSRNVNLFTENYWDKYKGYDINHDNIGDVPYRPVSLFSMIMERTPETIFLLRSFVVDILDIAEKVAPVFIPETLIDEKPLMKLYND